MDLLDLAGNVRDGIHLAAAGGTWQALVHGFGGFRDHDGDLRFQPVIPSGWDSLTFRLRHHDNVIEVRAGHDQVVYRLVEGTRSVVHHWDEMIVLEADSSATRRNPRREEMPRLSKRSERPLVDQPAHRHDTGEFGQDGAALPFT